LARLFLMTTRTLVRIGYLIVHRQHFTALIMQLEVEAGARPVQGRLALIAIPDIGQSDPALLLVQQDASLDQPHPFKLYRLGAALLTAQQAPLGVARIVEGLAQYGAHRVIETGFAIPRVSA